MEALRRNAEQEAAGLYSEDRILESCSQIVGICLCAGLSLADAEDVAQDVWAWLLRRGSLSPAMSAPWMGAVARNFILRYWRKRYRQGFREGVTLEDVPEPQSAEQMKRIESNELLDRVAEVLPGTERKLLALIRSGYTLAEAGAFLGIPRGSRAYFGGRLIACARREMKGRNVPLPQKGH